MQHHWLGMPKFPKIDFKRFLQRGAPHTDSTKSHAPRPSLSVNSLSKISDQMSALAQGENIRRVSFWLCFILCANFTADLFALLFEKYLPTPPVSALASRGRNGAQSSPVAYEIITDRNLFSSKAPKKATDAIDLEAEPVPTSLGLQLIGTVIFHNPARSIAAIQDKADNKLFPVRMGDQLNDNVQILSVEARKVIFINSQARRREFLEIPEDPAIKISTSSFAKSAPTTGIAQVEENKFVLSRKEVDAQMANFNVLITQARALPEMRGGQMIGFKLTQIVPGSFFASAGFKDGDIITKVNGEPMTDAAKALSLFQDLKTMNSVDIGYEANGKAGTRNYDIR